MWGYAFWDKMRQNAVICQCCLHRSLLAASRFACDCARTTVAVLFYFPRVGHLKVFSQVHGAYSSTEASDLVSQRLVEAISSLLDRACRTDQLWSIKGGAQTLVDKLVHESQASVHLGHDVFEIEKPLGGGYKVSDVQLGPAVTQECGVQDCLAEKRSLKGANDPLGGQRLLLRTCCQLEKDALCSAKAPSSNGLCSRCIRERQRRGIESVGAIERGTFESFLVCAVSKRDVFKDWQSERMAWSPFVFQVDRHSLLNDSMDLKGRSVAHL
jgi:hypothetical protein